MEKDNVVYLLIGQRGAGKSYYCKKLVEKQPDLQMISRDEILIRLFGSENTSPYTGAQAAAQVFLNRLLRRRLSTQTGLRLLLDTWTGSSRERKSLITKLRKYGATRVVAMYFITDLNTVKTWFWQKPGIAKASEMKSRKEEGLIFFSEHAPAHDHQLFHELAKGIDRDGFDQVIRVNPEKDLITLP